MIQKKKLKKWDKRFTTNKLQNYSSNLTEFYDKKIFDNVQVDLIPIKQAFLEKRRKIFKDFTVSEQQIKETIKKKKEQERKKDIKKSTKYLKKVWEQSKILEDPFFMELLKNIKFSIKDENLKSKLDHYIDNDIPEQQKSVQSINKSFISLSNCYQQIKEVINRINTFQDRQQVEENINNLIDQIDDYRKLNLIFFEKLVQWKLKNELQGYYLFEGQQLCQLRLFVWENKNVFREISKNYNILQRNEQKKHISLSSQDLFFLKAYFKFDDKVVSLRNDSQFLKRVQKIERLFETIDNNYQSFSQKFNIQSNDDKSSFKIQVSREEYNNSVFESNMELRKKQSKYNMSQDTDDVLNKKIDNNQIEIVFDTNQNYYFEKINLKEGELKKLFYFHITQIDQEHLRLIQQHYRIFQQQISNCNCPYFYCLRLQKDKKEQFNLNNMFGLLVFDVKYKYVEILHISVRKNFKYINFLTQAIQELQNDHFKNYIFTVKYKQVNSELFKSILKSLMSSGFNLKFIESQKHPIVELQLLKKIKIIPYSYEQGEQNDETIQQIQQIDRKNNLFIDKKIEYNVHNITLDIFITFSNKYRLFCNLNSVNPLIDLQGYYFYIFMKYFEKNIDQINKEEIIIWKNFFNGISNKQANINLEDVKFQNHYNFEESMISLREKSKDQMLKQNINRENFKLTISQIQQNFQLQNSFLIEYQNQQYIRIAPSKVFYQLKIKKIDYTFYLIPTQNPNFYFYFVKIENIESQLEKVDYKVNNLVKYIFRNFDLNQFKRCEQAIYVKTFSFSLKDQKDMNLVNLFSNVNSVDISSITFDFEFKMEGKSHDSGLIYDINEKNTLKDSFLLGMIHAKMDEQIKYPIFSYLKCNKEIRISKQDKQINQLCLSCIWLCDY